VTLAQERQIHEDYIMSDLVDKLTDAVESGYIERNYANYLLDNSDEGLLWLREHCYNTPTSLTT